MTQSAFTPNMRRNWGWWDGINARKRNKHPLWCKPWEVRATHPSDRIYGEAFWAGWYGEPHPVNGMVPGEPAFAYYGGDV